MAYTIFKALMTVLIALCVICFLVWSGGFDRATTEVGLEHYAEKRSPLVKKLLPKWIKMPLNTMVNVGYICFGAYWCAVIYGLQIRLEISETDAFLFYMFNIMACFYTPIQTIRILIQKPRFAILDQWVTLPFFMWVFVWGKSMYSGWSEHLTFVCMAVSIASYVLPLYTTIGFEIALGCHVCIAIIGAILAYKKHKTSAAFRPFLCAMLSCAGFVILKLLDLHLPLLHPVFARVSGHFLFKIADFLQVHYVCEYFLSLLEHKMCNEDKKNQ